MLLTEGTVAMNANIFMPESFAKHFNQKISPHGYFHDSFFSEDHYSVFLAQCILAFMLTAQNLYLSVGDRTGLFITLLESNESETEVKLQGLRILAIPDTTINNTDVQIITFCFVNTELEGMPAGSSVSTCSDIHSEEYESARKTVEEELSIDLNGMEVRRYVFEMKIDKQLQNNIGKEIHPVILYLPERVETDKPYGRELFETQDKIQRSYTFNAHKYKLIPNSNSLRINTGIRHGFEEHNLKVLEEVLRVYEFVNNRLSDEDTTYNMDQLKKFAFLVGALSNLISFPFPNQTELSYQRIDVGLESLQKDIFIGTIYLEWKHAEAYVIFKFPDLFSRLKKNQNRGEEYDISNNVQYSNIGDSHLLNTTHPKQIITIDEQALRRDQIPGASPANITVITISNRELQQSTEENSRQENSEHFNYMCEQSYGNDNYSTHARYKRVRNRARPGRPSERQRLITTFDMEEPISNVAFAGPYVKQVSNYFAILQAGIIARDLISEAAQSHFDLMAVTVGTAAAPLVISHYGPKLVDTLIRKVLLKMTPGRNLLRLVKILRGFSSCLATIGLDFYTVIDLIERCKSGDKLHAGLDALILFVDEGMCAAHIFSSYFGLALLTPGIGEVAVAFSTVTFLGAEIYDAYQKVSSVKRIINLTLSETVIETVTGFLHLTSWIDNIKDKKEGNELMVRQILGSKDQSVYNRHILPNSEINSRGHSLRESNNYINLTHSLMKKTISREMPVDITGISLFCQKEVEVNVVHARIIAMVNWLKRLFKKTENEKGYLDYYCENAFGFEIISKETPPPNDKTLFHLGNGNDTVVGFPKSPNTFILGRGSKTIIGGNADDVFKLVDGLVIGILIGAAGRNVLDLSDFNPEIWVCFTDEKFYQFHGEKISILNLSQEFFSKNAGKIYPLEILNINKIIGRSNIPEIVHVECYHEFLSMQGGSSEISDEILIPDRDCNYNLTINLTGKTDVLNNAGRGQFAYTYMSKDLVETSINLEGSGAKSIHTLYFLSMKWHEIKMKHTLENKMFDIRISSQTPGGLGVKFHTQLQFSIHFEDKVSVSVRANRLIINTEESVSVPESLDKYANHLNESGATLIVQSTPLNETILMHNTTETEPAALNNNSLHIISNDVSRISNMVAMANGSYMFNIKAMEGTPIDEVKVPTVNIYTLDANKIKHFVSFHSLVEQLRKLGQYELRISIYSENSQDIVLRLTTLTNGYSVHLIGLVRLVKAYLNNAYENYVIIRHNDNKIRPACFGWEDEFELQPIHLHHENENIVLLNSDEIEKSTVLFFNPTVSSSTLNCYKVVNSIVISNGAQDMNDPSKALTIFMVDYLVMPVFETLSFCFADGCKSVSKEFVTSKEQQPANRLIKAMEKKLEDYKKTLNP